MNLPTCFELVRGFAPGFDLGQVQAHELEQKTIKLFGKERPTPRLTKWYGERAYTYSGIENAPEPMPAWLEALRAGAEKASGARFNSALVNYYRDGKDSVAWHADDEPELGSEPTIASLSFGASRTFAVKPRAGGESVRLSLADGDLLIMRGESQSDYLHAVPKTTREIGPRVNVTFRWVS